MQKFGKTTRLLHGGKCEGRNIACLGMWGDLPDWAKWIAGRAARGEGTTRGPRAGHALAVTPFLSARPGRVPVLLVVVIVVAIGGHEALELGSRKNVRAGRWYDIENPNLLSLLLIRASSDKHGPIFELSLGWRCDVVLRKQECGERDGSACRDMGSRYTKSAGSVVIYRCRSWLIDLAIFKTLYILDWKWRLSKACRKKQTSGWRSD